MTDRRKKNPLDSADGLSQRRTSRRNFIRYGVATTGALATAMYVKPEIRSLGIPSAFAAMSGPPTSDVWVPYCIHFDESFVSKGDVIKNQYAGLGVTVATKTYYGYSNPNHPAVIFNSASPTGGDYDLGTPNSDFSGPGIGSGGGSGQAGENSVAQQQVLIVHEQWTSTSATSVSNPDDDASGGRLVFTFDAPVRVDLVQVLDIDDGNSFGSRVRTYDDPAGGSILFDYQMPDLGENSFQSVNVNDSPSVRRLEVIFKGSGAVAKLCWSKLA